MSRCRNLTPVHKLTFTAVIATVLFASCGGDQTMATKSEKAFEEAQRKGIPIAKGGHGGHTNSGGEAMSGMAGSDTAAPDSAGSPGGMKGMDMSASKSGGMKGMDMSGSKTGAMKGMGVSGSKSGGMKGMDMSGSKTGAMKGMDMSGSKSGAMKGMDMSGSKTGAMKGMDMSGSKSGAMKGMDMSGAKTGGGMKGMDMSGWKMSPVVPQPTALQARSGDPAATLNSDPLDAPAPSALASAQRSADMNGMAMSMGSYVQHDAGGATSSSPPVKGMEPGMPGMKHDASPSHAQSSPKTSHAVYVCASHPEIVRDRPGKCPIDGTALVKEKR
jgi:hypothetical protein